MLTFHKDLKKLNLAIRQSNNAAEIVINPTNKNALINQ